MNKCKKCGKESYEKRLCYNCFEIFKNDRIERYKKYIKEHGEPKTNEEIFEMNKILKKGELK